MNGGTTRVGWLTTSRLYGRRWLLALAPMVLGFSLAHVIDDRQARADGGEDCASQTVGGAAAVRLAVVCQTPVEVVDARTPWESLTAQPSGELTWTATNIATRTSVHGGWEPVDVTVVSAGDGLAPVAPVLPMVFSSGGSAAPLARLEHEGRVLEMFAPWPLPTPTVSGSTITYPSVLPGVDLVVSVDDDGTGFSEVLVVRTAEAAANPALAELSFPLRTFGEVAVIEVAGGLGVVDSSGIAVFESPTPRMWDSSGTAGGQDPPGPDAPAVDERVHGPVDGDVVAEMPVDLADGAVSITPDQAVFGDADTVWPVYIDPTWDASEGVVGHEWTMISSGFATTEYYKWAGRSSDQTEATGFCDVSVESSCNKDQVKRLIWEFTIPAGIRGSVVSSAEFAAWQHTAYDCDTGWARLYQQPAISSSTNWSNFHSNMDGTNSIDSVDQTRRPGCSLSSGWTRWNATTAARNAANNSWTILALGLRSTNETSMPSSWKRFKNNASLSITFNRYPNTPGLPSLDPSVSVPLGGKLYAVRDSTPALFATVSDPDAGQTVRGIFQIWNGSTKVWEGQSWLFASGTKVTPNSSPPTLAEGPTYTVRVWAKDNGGLQSRTWSDYIQFKVDVTPPAALPIVVPQDVGTGVDAKYVESEWAGGPGKVGKFKFTPNGVTDIDRYRYSFDSLTYTNEVDAAGNGESASLISYAPPKPGLHTLRVWTVDTAGWVSEDPREYQFYVYAASKAAWWLLDGNGEDATATGADAALTGGGSWVEGPLVGQYPGDQAVHLDGSTGVVSTTTGYPVVHTSGDFTITALVREDGALGTRAVASQDGYGISGFRLGIVDDSSVCPVETGTRCWAFGKADVDDADSDWTWAIPQVNPEDPYHFAVPTAAGEEPRWVALAGVYDSQSHELRLYVDGELAGTAAFDGADWDAVGKFRIGVGNGGPQAWWSGDIDDVRAYRTALDQATIFRIAQGSRDATDVPQ